MSVSVIPINHKQRSVLDLVSRPATGQIAAAGHPAPTDALGVVIKLNHAPAGLDSCSANTSNRAVNQACMPVETHLQGVLWAASTALRAGATEKDRQPTRPKATPSSASKTPPGFVEKSYTFSTAYLFEQMPDGIGR